LTGSGPQLSRLLAWMAARDFSEIESSGLLRDVENIVVESHRRLYKAEGRAWSPPTAYRWLRYEDPQPVLRLAEGVKRLRRRGADFDRGAVENASEKACASGFSN
jgi:hypothetical protein